MVRYALLVGLLVVLGCQREQRDCDTNPALDCGRWRRSFEPAGDAGMGGSEGGMAGNAGMGGAGGSAGMGGNAGMGGVGGMGGSAGMGGMAGAGGN
jgi:hypothetical protein